MDRKAKLFADGQSINLKKLRKEVQVDLTKDYIKGADASQILRVPVSTLRRWYQQGKVNTVTIGRTRYYLIADIVKVLHSNPSLI